MPRAVELLRFAIEDRPDTLRPWLALFEIYRLERLSGEYAELAGRFRDRHAATQSWPKVQAFGREIDPANPLYQQAPMKSLETIGPREARLIAASNVDPLAENWLEAPMDFENEVLATELRRSLMGRAGVDDRDLVPNPMPALRSVEMFSVT
jgi:Tfp pilus assembly protein FimV